MSLFFRFGWEIIQQLYYFRRYVLPFLKEHLLQSDATFSEKYVRRMGYYAQFVPAVSGANYAILLGRKMTHTERLAMTELAAAAPIFDDYFDEEDLNLKTLSNMIENPESFQAKNTLEKVLVQLLIRIKAKIPNFPFFMEVCQKVFAAQLASKQQQQGNLSYEEIRKITYDKGGYSTLLFKSVMAHEPIQGEHEAIYHFGGLVQLVDDIFDVYEDTKNGIQTLATKEKSIQKVTQDFEADVMTLCKMFQALSLRPAAVRQFLHLQLFFLTRTFVCLEQFEKLQAAAGGIFEPKNYPRKALICDMETWENLRKWGSYFQKWRKMLRQSNHL
ncbi:MAG: class 1 isoprenoid biosynthesis enzyme [Bacteroidia bacterium]